MFEYNVRHGSIIGIVGAGGIGYYIERSLFFLAYDEVLAYSIIIFAVVIVIDVISVYARSFFNDDRNAVSRLSWKFIITGQQ